MHANFAKAPGATSALEETPDTRDCAPLNWLVSQDKEPGLLGRRGFALKPHGRDGPTRQEIW